jgi:hypothetical protein
MTANYISIQGTPTLDHPFGMVRSASNMSAVALLHARWEVASNASSRFGRGIFQYIAIPNGANAPDWPPSILEDCIVDSFEKFQIDNWNVREIFL